MIIFSLMTSSGAFALSITCSMYPVYDFARHITGDSSCVKLLMRPGVEPHDFEPSPLDVKALNDSDVFIFTGANMEHWAERISHTLTHTVIIDASRNIPVVNNDPHIWLDLSLAQKMIANITEGLCTADPSHADTYTHNADDYSQKISELDAKFSAMKKTSALVFAGEFSHGYFVRRYGFDYISAYDGENEPSVKRLAEVLKYIREHNTRYIFADSFGVSAITRSISEQTGAEILTFDTAHNVQDTHRTFLEIMTENYDNIQRAMNEQITAQ